MGFDDKILSLYARGMTVREIQGHLAEMYGTEVSPSLISSAIGCRSINEFRLHKIQDTLKPNLRIHSNSDPSPKDRLIGGSLEEQS